MYRSARSRFLIAALGLGLSACTTASSAWWTFQADVQRTGRSSGIGPKPNLYWQVPLVSGTISLTPPVFGAIGDTFRVFIGSGYGDGRVFALSPYTGATIWTFTAVPGTGFFGAPAAADDNVYIASKGNTPHVYALTQRTGAVIWQTPLPATGSGASVAVAHGMVFVNTDQHIVYALDQNTGAIVWSAPTSPGATSQESSPSVTALMVFVASDDGLFAFALNGALLWKYNLTGPVGFSSPVLDGGSPPLVFIGTNDLKLHAVNAATGANVWTHTASGTLAFHTVATGHGRVYLIDLTSVVALDRNTGAVSWTQAVGTFPRHSPAIAGNELFFQDNMLVQGMNALTGAFTWKAPLPGNGNPNSPGNAMAIALEILLVPNKGTLYAFR